MRTPKNIKPPGEGSPTDAATEAKKRREEWYALAAQAAAALSRQGYVQSAERMMAKVDEMKMLEDAFPSGRPGQRIKLN